MNSIRHASFACLLLQIVMLDLALELFSRCPRDLLMELFGVKLTEHF